MQTAAEKNQIARINRRLVTDGYKLRSSTPRQDNNLGRFHVIDVSRNIVTEVQVNLDDLEADVRKPI